ncbi:uncharacterized protein LOC116420820 [Sarcophilus harrisii]|uniref:uncharacterized protein LOC116420820 n=1 Tax=Sarcophilus harrisii TaxID=9305 RepID=UPI001301DEC6|nr:uncharacterized protein LOC116420820 [Sarcophilus harrisii]
MGHEQLTRLLWWDRDHLRRVSCSHGRASSPAPLRSGFCCPRNLTPCHLPSKPFGPGLVGRQAKQPLETAQADPSFTEAGPSDPLEVTVRRANGNLPSVKRRQSTCARFQWDESEEGPPTKGHHLFSTPIFLSVLEDEERKTTLMEQEAEGGSDGWNLTQPHTHPFCSGCCLPPRGPGPPFRPPGQHVLGASFTCPTPPKQGTSLPRTRGPEGLEDKIFDPWARHFTMLQAGALLQSLTRAHVIIHILEFITGHQLMRSRQHAIIKHLLCTWAEINFPSQLFVPKSFRWDQRYGAGYGYPSEIVSSNK